MSSRLSYAVVLVPSTNHALQAETILTRQDIHCKLIPVPRHISSECGFCVRILQADKEHVSHTLGAANVHIAGIYDL
ncbi:DUF3343 domain-containing protein [candidate division KSB3 bacterium]|uniref:DUF3343 domain-containing protein n=1 Tax=candidate division KSB3 bacterium TaxID=2044937 RepID=A0A9D5JX28_9BACT|nr:DUF3343 domain-containing protein [candidate division KSB3 bacterium]MBD3325685.1 DUF3343 domain-containing protein [candidate division KSB3 bacterium]